MWIKNAWYVAAWAKDVTEDALLARTYLGEPTILYRTADGTVTALEDRCCHRHAPLSKGRLEGDQVRCMYHGLKFAPTGECIEIPGDKNIPAKYRVRQYPVVEKQNLVWIWMGDADQADPADIIDYPYMADEAWSYKGGYMHYGANYRLVVDNFLDFSHLPFVHANTIGADVNYAEQRPVIEHMPFGLHIENLTFDTAPTPSFQRLFPFDGNIDRWSIYDLHMRGNCLLGDFGSAPVGEGGHTGNRKKAMQFRHLSAMTPETENTSHYHFAQARNFGLDAEGLDDMVLKTVIEAFLEDQEIIEAQQKIIDQDPAAPMLPIAADRALLHIRRETDKVIAAEQAGMARAAE